MGHELTKDGLFSYFDPLEVERLIKLPLVRRNISMHEYTLCKEACATYPRSARSTSSFRLPNSPNLPTSPTSPTSPNLLTLPGFLSSSKQGGGLMNAALSFEALSNATVREAIEYLSIKRVKAIYSLAYGDYYLRLVSNLMASKDKPYRKCGDLFPLIDEIGEQKLFLAIKAAIGVPLIAFQHILDEQDHLLEEIACQFTSQASNAQEFIANIQARDVRYKQMIINLGFSLLKLGLSVVNAGELINITAKLTELASSALDKVQSEFPGIVLEIQKLVANTNFLALQRSEKELFSTAMPRDIERRWTMYRCQVFHNAKKSIQATLDTCVDNDTFFRCVIRDTLARQPNLDNDTLLIQSTKTAVKYVSDILNALKSQVAKIRHIRDAALSAEGSEKIERYFRQICLINYAKEHKDATDMSHKWLTKEFGHLLAREFPHLVFQEKWSPVSLMGIFHQPVKYCRQTITAKEYRELRRKSVVVLGLIRNSSTVLEALCTTLSDQVPHLSNCLITELQNQLIVPRDELPGEALHHYTDTVVKRAKYEVTKPTVQVIFDFLPPGGSTEDGTTMSVSSPTSANTPVLISHRSFSS